MGTKIGRLATGRSASLRGGPDRLAASLRTVSAHGSTDPDGCVEGRGVRWIGTTYRGPVGLATAGGKRSGPSPAGRHRGAERPAGGAGVIAMKPVRTAPDCPGTGRRRIHAMKGSHIVERASGDVKWFRRRVVGKFGPGRGCGSAGRGAERTRAPAPTEPGAPPSGPGPRCRANPSGRLRFAFVRPRAGRGAGGRAARRDPRRAGPGAERTRARPHAHRGAAPCGPNPGCRARTARDRLVKEHPLSSGDEAASFSESAMGCGSASPPGQPGAGKPGFSLTHDPPRPARVIAG
jgi:hypothetical protein